MANAMTLKIIRDYGNKDFYDYATRFMKSQPAEYALGVLMEDVRYLDFISVFNSKKLGVDSNLQQKWLNYVKGTPDWDGLKNGIICCIVNMCMSSKGNTIHRNKNLFMTL